MSPALIRPALPSSAAWAAAVAASLAGALRCELDARPLALLVLSGGATARAVLPRLAAEALPWHRVVLMPADERWVSPDHPDSNEGLIRTRLADAVAPARLVGLKSAHTEPEQALEAVARRLAAEPWPAAAVFLGMGTDGHIASLFPGDSTGLDPGCALRACRRPDHPRLGLGPELLLSARRIVLALAGADKGAVLSRALVPGSTLELPVRLVLHQDRAPIEVISTPDAV